MSSVRYLLPPAILDLHEETIANEGGSLGLRDAGLLASACAQPRQTFGGEELYPTLVSKAAALAYSLVRNHPFIDGNKRIGFVAMHTFLLLNGFELIGTEDDQVEIFLALAAGDLNREQFENWITAHLQELATD